MGRSAALLLAVLLAACSRGEQAAGAAAQGTAAQPDDRIRCALGGAKNFAPACTREVTQGADGETWIVRHPDGGFRRFALIEGGTRIAAADGADEVQAQRVGADLEVQVAGERYLFPAAPETKAPASHAPTR